MNSLKEKIVDISTFIERQLPSFVVENNPKFVSFLSSYYESQESKYNYLDIIKNFIEYYNVGHYSPSTLVKSTKLSSNITDTTTTISVLSTSGFPETNGYIYVGNEIVFYRSKTAFQFVDCVRQTSAFVLENTPINQIQYKSGSSATPHSLGTPVINIAYSFTNEFLRRIKSEIAPNFPESLSPNLNIASFLKNIKSFYLAKGSERSHQILFRILFNDKKLKVRLTNSGSGGNIKILNYDGSISAYQLISGGSGYYYELDDAQNLISPPIIDIIGSGTGSINELNQIPSSAQMVVDGMNSDGAITSVKVVNVGQNYVGPITARVRSRSFFQDQKITNKSLDGSVTGTARVDSWDSASNELILTDIVGYFRVGDKLIGEGGENPRYIISKAYPVTDINKEGNPSIEIISQDVKIEYPKNYLIKPSSASFYKKQVIRCELLKKYSTTKNLDGVNFIELVQSRDLLNKISGTSLEITEISQLSDTVYEFEIGLTTNYKKLYLPSSSTITQTVTVSSLSNSNIQVESTFNFPHKKGKLYIDDQIIQYESKTETEFVNCKLVGSESITLYPKTNVYLYGRECLTAGEVSYFIKGYVDGDRTTTPILFRLHALPSQPIIEDGGSLYQTDVFELDPETTYKLSKTILTSSKYNYGEIDEIIVENKGVNYKTGDKLIVNNQGNTGTGFNAQVSSIDGSVLLSYKLETINEQYCITFTTSTPHGLSVKDLVKFSDVLGTVSVFHIESSTEFSIRNIENLTELNLTGLSYFTNSLTATGSIHTITITNKGKNYTTLPEITGIETTTGSGALVQINSNNIGKLVNFEYSSIGGELIGNKTTKYPISLSSTAKFINNFELARIRVISGGINYNSTTDIVKVDGVVNPNYEFKIITSSGVITDIQVLRGGFNLTYIPSITVESSFGTGATFVAEIKRKLLKENQILTFTSADSNIKAKVVRFNVQSSSVEFNSISGIIPDNATVYTSDGIVYGNITRIKTASAYCTLSPYASYSYKFLDNYGFISDSTQRIIDSDYYQDWSYTLVSQRNTSEWKNQVVENTHPAGYKVFGKYRVENTKKVFERQEDVFNSSVIFKTGLSNTLNLGIKLSDCKKSYVTVVSSQHYSIGMYVIGNASKAIGIISNISENYLDIDIYNNLDFIVGEYLIVVPSSNYTQNTLQNLIFYYGILQEPFVSYYSTSTSIIPTFNFNVNDEILNYTLTNTSTLVDYLLSSSGTDITLFLNNSTFLPSSKEKLIISINGVVQNSNNFELSANKVTFDEEISLNSNIFILYIDSLQTLTFTQISPTTYSLNYIPPTNCNLIVFTNAVGQTHLLTDYTVSGNQITFSEPVSASDVFGWYIDEIVTCAQVDTFNILKSTITNYRPCTVKKLTEFIESNSVKSTNSIYQITKKLLDGTVYLQNDNKTVYGFDTKFVYTVPEYSSSYVEVLNAIQFNGTQKTFTLTYNNGAVYTPINGKDNLIVYINSSVLDPSEYTISGNQIEFLATTAYTSTDKCTIVDFISSYKINNGTLPGKNLDLLNVEFNSLRNIFNLSDNGVPQYIKNVGDIFVIKNGTLLRPDSTTYAIPLNTNKIQFNVAPTSSDNIKLLNFVRQISPEYTKNVLIDKFIFVDGVRSEFPLTVNGTLISPVNAYNLFVIRNGVYQKANIDYTIVNDTSIKFSTAPNVDDNIVIYYSFNGFNQNFKIDTFKFFDSVTDRYALTENFISISVESSSHLLVSRNGVCQYPEIDYTLENGPSIKFTTNPSFSDVSNITILNCNSSNDLVNITSRFSQDTVYTLTYTSTSPVVDTSVFLIYINGILQDPTSWSFNQSTNKLTFTEFVSLQLDKIQILAFENQKRILDSFTVLSGVDTYNLSVNGTQIASDYPTNEADLIVLINGVVQNPKISYTITNNTITLNTPIAGESVYIYQIGTSTNPVQVLDSLDSNQVIDETGTNYIYKLLSDYTSVNPSAESDIIVLRNGVLQESGVDFTVGNGYIVFSTNIAPAEDLFIFYAHSTDKIQISSIAVDNQTITLSTSINSNEYQSLILYVNGVPQFYGIDFIMLDSTTAKLIDITADSSASVFALKYAPTSLVDFIDDRQDGIKTKFKLLYNGENLIASDIVDYADILVSINGIIQYPGVDYTLNVARTFIDFTTAPQDSDDIFMIRMYGNQVVNLTNVFGNTYDLDQVISAFDQENFVVFSNNQLKFYEFSDFAFDTTSRITLASAHNTGKLFAIKFYGVTKVLDEINTPFNGSNTKFNLFYDEENYMPNGTITNFELPSATSILVFKNGKLLDSSTEYSIQGNIKSQIVFTQAPISTDKISIKSVGAFNKLTSIIPNGGKVYSISMNGSAYYPNSIIERPRDHENQFVVAKDGVVQSPLYDFYIENNIIKFNSNISGSKITILDFMGAPNDMNVMAKYNQINSGDIIHINGEENEREIDKIISPTIMTTKEIINNGNLIVGNTYIVREVTSESDSIQVGDSFVATSSTEEGVKTCLSTSLSTEGNNASGFVGQAITSNGVLSAITVTSPGTGYSHPVILRTIGSGTGGKATVSIDKYNSYGISNPIIQYSGYNIINGTLQEVIPTSYIYAYKEDIVNTSSIRKATRLTSDINSNDEVIPVGNTLSFEKNPPIITITYKTTPTQVATFRPFVSDGRVIKVEIISAGSGYSDQDAQIQVIGGGGTGCILDFTLNSTGSVTNITVKNGGEGYDTNRVFIDNEIIQYTDTTPTELLGCTRGNSPTSHNEDTIVYFDKFI